MIEVAIKDLELSIMSLYAPNEDDPQYFLNLIQIVDKSDYVDRIIGGDYNLLLNVEKDRRGCFSNHNKSMEILQNYMESDDLVDIW